MQALYGMGGVGKTQVAAEYAHRFAASYDLIWWIDAEQDALIGDQVVSLGLMLGCVPAGSGTETARAAVLAELRAARDLDRQTLGRYRRSQGRDHLSTLRSASSLAADLRALGATQAARDLDQDTLERRRHVLGPDHPDTLSSAYNLTLDLPAIGQAAHGPQGR